MRDVRGATIVEEIFLLSNDRLQIALACSFHARGQGYASVCWMLLLLLFFFFLQPLVFPPITPGF